MESDAVTRIAFSFLLLLIIMTENAKGLVDVGELILKFAKVNRVTLHEDGVRPESDTDHTVMLSVCACSLAQKLYPNLDLGKVAQFAIVHDLVEAYANDTDSFGITEQAKEEKDKREEEALFKIKEKFDNIFPWIGNEIEEYESLSLIEARFVKTVDKLMSKITHILNNGQYFKNRNLNEETMVGYYDKMVNTAKESYGKDFPELIELMNEMILEARKVSYK